MSKTILEQVVEMSSELISPTYLTEEELVEEYVKSDLRKLFVHEKESDTVLDVNSVESGDQHTYITGFTLGGAYSEKDLQSEVYVDTEELIQRTDLSSDEFPVSQVKSVVVREAEQGNGFGSNLTAAILGELVKVTPVVAMIWERENNANKLLAETYGERQALLEDYFDESWECRECGVEDECSCAVSVYTWRP